MLCISEMILSTEDTAALVQSMQNNVQRVVLDDYPGPVDLDIDTLLTYNGRGEVSGRDRREVRRPAGHLGGDHGLGR